jgi:hypothetical protein
MIGFLLAQKLWKHSNDGDESSSGGGQQARRPLIDHNTRHGAERRSNEVTTQIAISKITFCDVILIL